MPTGKRLSRELKLKTNPHESLAFNRATTMAQKHLQRPSPHMLH